jgi:hypothetical protein
VVACGTGGVNNSWVPSWSHIGGASMPEAFDYRTTCGGGMYARTRTDTQETVQWSNAGGLQFNAPAGRPSRPCVSSDTRRRGQAATTRTPRRPKTATGRCSRRRMTARRLAAASAQGNAPAQGAFARPAPPAARTPACCELPARARFAGAPSATAWTSGAGVLPTPGRASATTRSPR